MPRRLKFRAWNSITQSWLQSSQIGMEGLGGILSLGMPNSERCIVMQFTGQIDKNGIDIYEGDIVRWFAHKEIIKVVEWRNDGTGYKLKRIQRI